MNTDRQQELAEAWAAAGELPTKEERNARAQEIFREYADVIAARSQPYYLGGDERYQFEISFDIDVSARTPATLMVL